MVKTKRSPLRRLLGLGAAAAVVLGSAVAVPHAADAADTTQVTVRVTRVIEGQAADGDGTPGDFFPRISINGGPNQDAPHREQSDFNPDWKISAEVPSDAASFPINIELWDYDDTFAGGDDHMDISPTNEDVDLNLTVDMATRTWTAVADQLPENGTVTKGDGDHGFPDDNDGRIALLQFDVLFGGDPDTDDDGIPDTVERFGVRDGLGRTIMALGTSPCRKSIALEIDWMEGAADGHTHKPKDAAIKEFVDAFAKAPVPPTSPCPYPGVPASSGVEMAILPGNAIPEKPVMGLEDDFRAARKDNFNVWLRNYAHYAIFVHDQEAGSSSSGLCCESTQGGKDFIVSLGSWHTTCVGAGANAKLDTTPAGDDRVVGAAIDLGPDRTCDTAASGDDGQGEAVGTGGDINQTATAREQAGTIMHELGHSLGIGHGGADGINYKPNYISNENYRFQFGIQTAPGVSHLDYSRAALPALNERSLDENLVLGTEKLWTFWVAPDNTTYTTPIDAAIDWDQDGTLEKNLAADLNNDNTCVFPGANGKLDTGAATGDTIDTGKPDKTGDESIVEGTDGDCDTLPVLDDVDMTILSGYDDWANIKYRAVEATTQGGEHAHTHEHADITFDEKVAVEQEWEDVFHPDVEVTKTVDQAVAEGGQTLSYVVGVKNIGPGTARDVTLTDTLPDGSVQTRTVGALLHDGETSLPFSYRVPCSTADGTVVTNRASATANDVSGRAEQDTANNTASASTTIRAPRITLTKTATSSTAPGSPITYALTYGNAGSTTAKNVTITDTLPAGVYYSAALDLGAGARPTTVLRNADGTTTLTWTIGDVPASATTSIEFTARPTLLFLGGETLTNTASVTFGNAAGCVYSATSASAATIVVVTPPSADPRSHGFWKEHPELRTSELLAAVQATDQRFDGAIDGALSNEEAQAVLAGPGQQPFVLRAQLLAVYLDLADHRINAGTVIESKLAGKLQLRTVRDAVEYAVATLQLPVNRASAARYDNATAVLVEIVTNRSPRY